MLLRHNSFAIFVSVLCVGNSAFGNDDSITTYDVTVGRPVNLVSGSPTNPSRCLIETNTGFEFSLVPRLNIPHGVSQSSSRFCNTMISAANRTHAGIWTIKSYATFFNTSEEPIVSRNLLRVFQRATVPVDVLRPPIGATVAVRLVEQFENLIGCIVELPTGESFDVFDNHIDTKGVRLLHQCGAMFQASENHEGLWRLIAVIRGEDNYSASFAVHIQSRAETSAQHEIVAAQPGTTTTIRVGPTDVIFCELESPTGRIVPLHIGRCRETLSPVTRSHIGNWTARYALPGQTSIIKKSFELVTFDNPALNVSIKRLPNRKEINLLCRVRANSMSFCKFVRPDGESMHISVGMGNEDYVYYGNGTHTLDRDRNQDCGITILNPLPVDYGTWQCILGINSNMLSGSIIQLSQIDSETEYFNSKQMDSHSVYVRTGDSYTIRCGINAVLTHCSVRSPNGTAYFATTASRPTPSSLLYTGAGLSLGECGVLIPISVASDQGEWQCNMGVSGGEERTSNISVFVTDSLLMPVNREVRIRDDTTRTVLSCRVLPGYDKTIDYCRWIHPDGSVVRNGTKHSKFMATQELQSCHLTIKTHDDSEFGRWICMAGFIISAEEASASVQVERWHTEDLTGIWIALAVGIAAAIAVGIAFRFFYARIRTKPTNRLSDKPPTYRSATRNTSPRSLPTNP